MVTRIENPEKNNQSSYYFPSNEFIVVKAMENGVTIIGLTRGRETKFNHTEKLDKGEAMIFQFTEHTSAMKIKGRASIFCSHGEIQTGE